LDPSPAGGHEIPVAMPTFRCRLGLQADARSDKSTELSWAVKIHQQGTIYNAYQQSFPVVLDLDATDDGHLSGFANFHGGNLRPGGFPVGEKFSVLTDDPSTTVL
jgi:hypothetical protein